MALINWLWLIPAFLLGTIAGFFCAYGLALALEQVFKEIRERMHLE